MSKKGKKISRLRPKGELKRRLLETALKQIRREGAHAMTLRSVAKGAGCTPMATYRHFGSKEALMAEISAEGFVALRQQIEEVRRTFPDEPIRQLNEVGNRYVQLGLKNSEHFLMMFGGFIRNHAAHPHLDQVARAAFDALVEIMRFGQEKKVFRDGDPEILALRAWSSVHGLVMLLINHRLEFLNIDAEHFQEVRDLMSHLVLIGLVSEGAARKTLLGAR